MKLTKKQLEEIGVAYRSYQKDINDIIQKQKELKERAFQLLKTEKLEDIHETLNRLLSS